MHCPYRLTAITGRTLVVRVPQSAASHSSVGSALRAYEYATLNMPAPTNQV
jgi:hypothetical protein